MSNTPIYQEALTEARRRTRKHSPERRELALMDARTDPEQGRELRAMIAEEGEL